MGKSLERGEVTVTVYIMKKLGKMKKTIGPTQL